MGRLRKQPVGLDRVQRKVWRFYARMICAEGGKEAHRGVCGVTWPLRVGCDAVAMVGAGGLRRTRVDLERTGGVVRRPGLRTWVSGEGAHGPRPALTARAGAKVATMLS